MNKICKILSMIVISTFITIPVLAEIQTIPEYSIQIGGSIFDLSYANDTDNQATVQDAVFKNPGKDIYIQTSRGTWFSNNTGLETDMAKIGHPRLINYNGKKLDTPIGEIKAVKDEVVETIEVYLNGTKLEFPAGLEPRKASLTAWYYGLPLSIMLKELGYDALINTKESPNILINGPDAELSTDFNASLISDKYGISGIEGKAVPVYDDKGKYIDTFMGSNIFEEKLGFKIEHEVTYVGNIYDTKILLTGIKGKGGVTLIDSKDGFPKDPIADPLSYVIKVVKPSMKKNVNGMENLQAIVKLIPTWNILYNDALNFRYDTALFAITAGNNLTYQEIMVKGDLTKNPIGVKIIKSILADIVGGADATEMYSALAEYNTLFFKDGNPSAMTAKYLKYRATKTKGHQFNITREGNEAFLDIK